MSGMEVLDRMENLKRSCLCSWNHLEPVKSCGTALWQLQIALASSTRRLCLCWKYHPVVSKSCCRSSMVFTHSKSYFELFCFCLIQCPANSGNVCAIRDIKRISRLIVCHNTKMPEICCMKSSIFFQHHVMKAMDATSHVCDIPVTWSEILSLH